MPTDTTGLAAPTLLAFELATEACSVALMHRGQCLARHALAPRRHAELALPWADALLAEAGLPKSAIDALAVGVGPGAFTGVRLAISLVQGMALGLDRPVVPVSTLAALAQPFLGFGPVLALIDARMGEVYSGAYLADDDGLPRPSVPEALLPLASAAEALGTVMPGPPSEGWSGVGTGFAAGDGRWWQALPLERVEAGALPTAVAVAHIARRDLGLPGRAIAPERIEPSYLRDKVALTAAEQAAARARRDG
jgi:tRNA threonylcarbamoyladenosine biosynthesis protein TsaB